MLNESAIIHALHESAKKKCESGSKCMYKCPECGFETEEKVDVCPECGAKMENCTKDECTKKEAKCGSKKEGCGSTDKKEAKCGSKKEGLEPQTEGAEVQKEDDPGLYICDHLYMCPECGEYFTSTVNFNGTCWCPECGEEITPEYVGEVEDVTGIVGEAADEDGLVEMEIKVSGNKIIKFRKPKKAGFKRVGGKYVKMSSKEKMARKKAGKKMGRKGLGHKGAANMKRKKSMKKRAARGLNDALNMDESVVMQFMNTVFADVFEQYKDEFYSFQVESIEDATLDGDTLTLEAVVAYEDGDKADATFVMEGFGTDTITVTESTGVFDIEGVAITAKGEIMDESIEMTEMSYSFDKDGQTFAECYYIDEE